jgi:OmpA-OmpF porin, OOP family
MSSIVKFILGGLLTALLTWVLFDPMKLGSKCAADAAPAATPADTVATPVPATAPPAAPEVVANCQTKVDEAIKGKTINFGSGNAVITEYSKPIVDAVAAALKGCAGTAVLVSGHTDQQGDDASNMKLSDARASAVVAALAERGVTKDQLSAKGFGETKLLDTGTSKEALAKNRRIEFTVSSATATPATADAPAAETAAEPKE